MKALAPLFALAMALATPAFATDRADCVAYQVKNADGTTTYKLVDDRPCLGADGGNRKEDVDKK